MKSTCEIPSQFEVVPIESLIPDSANARIHDERNITEIARSLREFGQHAPLVVQRATRRILVGNGRFEAMKRIGWTDVRVQWVDDDNITAVRRALADNRTAELASWDDEILSALINGIEVTDIPGWTEQEINALIGEVDINGIDENGDRVELATTSLAESFGIPPFSVLNSRDGVWQARKKAWIDIGLKSELGRVSEGEGSKSGGLLFKSRSIADHAFYDKKNEKESELGRKLSTREFIDNYYEPNSEGANSGTSIFDPVLCELIYRWFSRVGDRVLDPFAGGSVRGVIASRLRREYTGLDIRPDQVEANNQHLYLCDGPIPEWIAGDSRQIDNILKGRRFDFLMSCPPYVDLEVYSDNPCDLSTMDYSKFMSVYREIIAKSCSLLEDDSFACFIVGEVRDKSSLGFYYGFVADTIKAFEDSGARFYNEAILVNPIGTLAIRIRKQFETSRKIGKTHQNILVFVKGDPKKATERLGVCDLGDIACTDDM